MRLTSRFWTRSLLLASCAYGLVAAPGLAQDSVGPEPDQDDQEQAAETAAEGDAKALGQPAVPTSEDLVPEDNRTLEEIVITGQIAYRNRTETIAPELTYDHEFFQKFEPTSVGDSLKRVPGVSFSSDVGEYDSPELRGLGAGFTQILVNGRPIPGGGNDRTVFVDRIPAEIIDRIEIIRSPSADIDSQGIGGSINIILKDGTSLPPGVITRAAAMYYPSTNTLKGAGAVSLSGRNEAETIAYSLTVDAQQRYNPKFTREEVFEDDAPGFEDSETGEDLFKPFDRQGSTATERVEELDTRRSFDLSLNADVTFKLGGENSLRFDGFFIRTRRTDTEQTLVFVRPEDDDEDPIYSEPFEFDDIELAKDRFKQENFGVSTLYEGRIGPSTSIEAQARYSQFKETNDIRTYVFDTDLFDPVTSQTDEIRFTEDAELSENELTDSNDREISGDVAVKHEFGNASIKAGVAGKIKKRDFGIELFEEDDGELELQEAASGNFDYEEKRLDAFLVGEVKFGAAELQAGVRAEHTKISQVFPLRDLDPDSDDFGAVIGEDEDGSKEFHLNPSAHLNVEFGDGGQFRASVARTIRRPAIDQLIPAFAIDEPDDDDATVGNADLKFETSWGIDIGVEHRLPGRGIVGVNFFHRWVKDLIGLDRTGEEAPGGGDLYSYFNLGSGKVYGIEFDLSTSLTMVGLRNTGIFANYTRLWSSRTDPNTLRKVEFNSQPKYVYNVGLTQELPTIASSFGFSYRKQGSAQSFFFTEQEFQRYGGNLEAFIEKRIGKNFVLRLSGNNLLDARSFQWERNYDDLEDQRAGIPDNFEVEHEETSRQIMLTARLVF